MNNPTIVRPHWIRFRNACSRAYLIRQASFLLAVSWSLLALQTRAATVTWDGSADEKWKTAANWSGGSVPTTADHVVIPTSDDYTNALTEIKNADVLSMTIQNGGTATLGVGSNHFQIGTGGLDIQSGGTYSITQNKNTTVTGDVTINGTYSQIDGKLIFAGTAQTFSGSGNITSTKDMKVNAGTTVTLGSDITIDGKVKFVPDGTLKVDQYTLTLNGKGKLQGTGTLDMGGASNGDVVVEDKIDVTTITNFGSGSTMTLGKDLKFTTLNPGSGTIVFNGHQKQKIPAPSSNYNNITISNTGDIASSWIEAQGDLDINGDLVITDGKFNLAGFDLNLAGDWNESGTGAVFQPTNETVTFDGTTNITQVSGNYFCGFTVAASSTVTLASDVRVDCATTINGTGTLDLGNPGLPYTFTANGNVTNSGTIDNGNGTFKLDAASTFTDSSGAFTADVGTFLFSSTTAQNVPNYTYYNLTFEENTTYTAQSALTVNNNVTIENTATFDANSNDLTVGGDWDNDNGGAFTPGTQTVTMTGNGKTIYSTIGTDFHALTIGDGSNTADITFSNASNITASGTVTVTAKATLKAGRGTHLFDVLTINNGSPVGTLDLETSSLTVTNATTNNGRIDVTETASSLDMNGNFTNGATGTLDATSSSTTIRIAGDWTDSAGGTFNVGTSTVEFDGANSANLTTAASSDFYHLTINKSSNGVVAKSNLDVNGNLTLSNGGFDLNDGGAGRTLNLAGNWSVSSGTLTQANSTVIFDGDGGETIDGEQFNNVQVSNTGTGISINAGLTIDGTLTVNAGGVLELDTGTTTIDGATVTVSGTFKVSGTSTVVNLDNGGSAGPDLTVDSGALELRDGAILEFDSNVAVTIGSSNGTFLATGPGKPTIRDTGTTGYSFTVSGTNTLDVKSLIFDGADSNGLHVTGRSAVVDIDNVDFQDGDTVHLFLDLPNASGPSYSFDSLTFDAVGPPTNIKTSNVGAGNAYTVEVTNSGDGEANDDDGNNATITWTTSNQWDGSEGTSWNDPNNWSLGTVPTSDDTVLIPSSASVSNQPTLDVAGDVKNITIASGATVTVSGTNTLNVKGNFTNNGTFTAASGTVTFDGSGSQAIGGSATITFHDLVIGNTAATVSTTKAVNVSDDLTVNTGATLSLGGNLDVNDALTISGTGTLDATDDTINIAGAWSNSSGTFTEANSTVIFDGASQSIPAGEVWNNLTVGGSGASFSGTGPVDINGDFAINASGALNAGIYTLNVAGDWDDQGTFTPATSTVKFDGGGASNIANTDGSAFNHLQIASGTTLTVTNGETIDVDGTLTIDSGAVLDGTGDTIKIAGTWSNNGTFTETGSTVEFDGSAKTIPAGEVWNNLTVSGTSYTFTGTGPVDINGDFTLTGTLDAETYTLNLAGDWNDTGTFTESTSTVKFDGAGTSDLTNTDGSKFYNLTTSNATTLTVTDGEVVEVENDLTIESGTTFNGTNDIIKVAGDWDGSGAFTATGSTVTFDGTGAQSINAETFNILDITNTASDGDANPVKMTGDVTATTFNLNDGTFKPQTNTLTVTTGTVDSGSKFLMGNGSVLSVNTSFTVNGTLEATSSDASRSKITGDGSFTFTISGANADMDVDGLDFDGNNNDRGILVEDTAATSQFDNVTFSNITAAGGQEQLEFDNTSGNRFFLNVTFVNNTSSVRTTNTGSGTVYFIDFTNGDGDESEGSGTQIVFVAEFKWDGDDSTTLWDEKKNWNPEITGRPNATNNDKALIKVTGKNVYPQIEITTASCIALQINAGASLTINATGKGLDVNGPVTIDSGTATLTMASGISDATTLYVAGAWQNDGGVASLNAGTVDFDGTSAQSVKSGGDAFYIVNISNTSAAVSTSDNMDVNNDLTIVASAALDISGDTLRIGGDFTATGTLTTDTNSLVKFDGGVAQATTGFTTEDLQLSTAGTVVTPSGTVTVNDDMTIDASTTWKVNGQTVNVTGDLVVNGTLEFDNVGSGGLVDVAGNITLGSTGTILFNSTTTGELRAGAAFTDSGGTFTKGVGRVTYDGTAAQTIASLSYHHLKINNSHASAVVMTPGDVTITGRLDVADGIFQIDDGDTFTINSSSALTSTISSGGTIDIEPGSTLALHDNVTVSVEGTLEAKGTSNDAGNLATVTRAGSSTDYSLVVNGTINAQYYKIDYADANGLAIGPTSTITSMDEGNFFGRTTGYSLITMKKNAGGTITIDGVDFFDPGNIDNGTGSQEITNVRSFASTTTFSFTNHAGDLAGENFDDDVTGVIAWGATAVDLAGFAAKGTDGKHLRCTWVTGVETGNMGFHLYRSKLEEDDFQRINPRLVPSKRGDPTDRTYHYLDQHVTYGQPYRYKLADVDARGRETLHGPFVSDWDGDGMPDDWEIAHGLDHLLDDAMWDADGDGISNLDEYLNGTDPNVPDAIDGDDGTRRECGAENALCPSGGVEILYRSPTEVIFQLVTDAVSRSMVQLGDERMVKLAIAGYVHGVHGVPGAPAIPRTGFLETAQAGYRFQGLEILEIQEERHALEGRLLPVPYMVSADAGPVDALQALYQVDETLYPRTVYPSTEAIEAVPDGRDAVVSLFPLAYHPESGTLLVRKLIKGRLLFRRDAEAAGKIGHKRKKAYVPSHLTADPVYRVPIHGTGVHRLDYTFLQTHGVNVGALLPAYMRMYHMGKEIAIHVSGAEDGRFDPEDFVLFHARTSENKYAVAAPVYLTINEGPGRRVIFEPSASPQGQPYLNNFVDTWTLDENKLYQRLMDGPDGTDRWTDDVTIRNDQRAVYHLALPGLDRGVLDYDAKIRLRLFGWADVPHRIHLSVNLYDLGEYTWNGTAGFETAMTLNQVYLSEDAELVIDVLTEPGVAWDMVYMDRIDVRYKRRFLAEGNTLTAEIPDGRYAILARAFASPDTLAWDVTRPDTVRIYPPFDILGQPGDVDLLFVMPRAGDRGRTLLLSNPAVETVPAALDEITTQIRDAADVRGVEYLVVSSEALSHEARVLADYRASDAGGAYHTKLVLMDRVYDLENDGMAHPRALRNYIQRCRRYGKLKYVILCGDATYDPRNRTGLGVRNHVPTYLRYTDHYGETGSDLYYVTQGTDRILPHTSIGRLPAQTAQELHDMIQKIMDYEALVDSNTWEGNVHLVTDDEDDGFDAAADGMQAFIPRQFHITKTYRSQYASGAACRADVTARTDAGQLLTMYLGHGSETFWDDDQILRTVDIDGLNNTGRETMAVSITCVDGYYLWPYPFTVMCEKWLAVSNRGGIGSIASTGMSSSQAKTLLAQLIMQKTYQEDVRSQGEILRRAVRAYYAIQGGDREDALKTTHLFGDPALRLNMPAPAKPTGLRAGRKFVQGDDKRSRDKKGAKKKRQFAVKLTWDPNGEVDLAGYDLYRQERSWEHGWESWEKVNGDRITETGYDDGPFAWGTMLRYYILAVDEAGFTSIPSDQVAVPRWAGKTRKTPEVFPNARAEGTANEATGLIRRTDQRSCFLATAAYGAQQEGILDALRLYRDRTLLRSQPGTCAVATYYACSPVAARGIHRHETSRAVVRKWLGAVRHSAWME